jgi:hypothetical protein
MRSAIKAIDLSKQLPMLELLVHEVSIYGKNTWWWWPLHLACRSFLVAVALFHHTYLASEAYVGSGPKDRDNSMQLGCLNKPHDELQPCLGFPHGTLWCPGTHLLWWCICAAPCTTFLTCLLHCRAPCPIAGEMHPCSAWLWPLAR